MKLDRPVALLVQFSGIAEIDGPANGRLIWAGRPQQVLVGPIAAFEQARLYEFRNGRDAEAFVEALRARKLGALRVEALSIQPRSVALVSKLLARLLPHLPFDNGPDDTEEPGIGTSSVMPTREAIAAIRAHPAQDTPVVMINWLKFKDRAAYYRYGKVALVTTHSIGAKLIYAGRYLRTLIGEAGPGWDEFALMQYPGRAAFATMASLKRYRRGLADREAGLADNGQGLVLTEPAPASVWRR